VRTIPSLCRSKKAVYARKKFGFGVVWRKIASEVLATACSIAPTPPSMLALTLVAMFAGLTLIDAQSRRHALGMPDGSTCPSVERVAKRARGAWVFKGTRLPVNILFEHLEAGATVDNFLGWYEGVTREQVLDVLEAC